MNKADFYIGIDESAKWIGSALKYGDPTSINPKVLLIKNAMEYEDVISDFDNSFIYHWIKPEDGWPHLWQDSRMTDYSYHLFNGKVWCSMNGGQLFDPLIIIGGEDLIAAEKYAPRIKVKYPIMLLPTMFSPIICDLNSNETYCGIFK